MSPAILEMLTSIQLGLLFSPDTVKNIDENQEQGDQHRHSRLKNYWQSFCNFMYHLPGTTSGLTRKLTQLTMTNMKLGRYTYKHCQFNENISLKKRHYFKVYSLQWYNSVLSLESQLQFTDKNLALTWTTNCICFLCIRVWKPHAA